MAHRVDAPARRWPVAALVVAVAAVVVIGLLGAMVILGGGRSAASPGSNPSPLTSAPVAVVSPSPTTKASQSVPSVTTTRSMTPSPLVSATPAASATPSALSSPPAGAAPQSAAEFDVHGQVIDIGFPLRADTEYHYRDNWYERRDGMPDAYNHAKLNENGDVVRLHDGIDIYAPDNEPVVSPFDGVVIDPQTKWTPWEPDRYGLTVVVESDEATSPGYMAVLVHLDRVWVDVGQHVTRGQVIGVLGRTGNAEDVRPQLHFELRAPFVINWSDLGEARDVDAFNPYPSLTAADPE